MEPTLALLALCAPAGDVLAEPVRLEADGAVLDISDDTAYAGPWVFDYDGDGLRDLVVTSIRGTFRFFRNVGEPGAPAYTDAGLIEVGGEPLNLHNW